MSVYCLVLLRYPFPFLSSHFLHFAIAYDEQDTGAAFVSLSLGLSWLGMVQNTYKIRTASQPAMQRERSKSVCKCGENRMYLFSELGS